MRGPELLAAGMSEISPTHVVREKDEDVRRRRRVGRGHQRRRQDRREENQMQGGAPFIHAPN